MNIKSCFLFILVAFLVDVVKSFNFQLPFHTSKALQRAIPTAVTCIVGSYAASGSELVPSIVVGSTGIGEMTEFVQEFRHLLEEVPLSSSSDASKSTQESQRISSQWKDIILPGIDESNNSSPSKSLEMPVDIKETQYTYLFFIDLPGLRKNDIQLQIKNSELTISGKRSPIQREDLEDQILKNERKSGNFERSFTLPENIDLQGIEAVSTDGVLEIRIPKKFLSSGEGLKVEIL